ncbi:MAG: CRISPR-associated protein [Bacteroidales bacterium]|jgi:hypothetical protein|nr:CRISPR-associated protein [Bacteroidales bacterium]NPV36234.1 CRISPR-associated protein [Bacteroidales bacterium]
MLINLSNHPSTQWDENQINQAKNLYGNVIDLSFPFIDPDGDEEYIRNLTEEYFEKIMEISKNHSSNLAVHLMGEMTFAFQLAAKLLKNNIACIASTTERSVVENQNTKISKFRFVRFRRYDLT